MIYNILQRMIFYSDQPEVSRFIFEKHTFYDQGSHQNAPIIGPIGAFFVSRVNNEVIRQTLLVFVILQGLTL